MASAIRQALQQVERQAVSLQLTTDGTIENAVGINGAAARQLCVFYPFLDTLHDDFGLTSNALYD